MGPLVATIVRLIVPLFILRWPLGGLIASAIADTLDVVIIAAIRSGMFEDYTGMDKLLDTYMLVFAAIVAWRWENRFARFAGIALFGYRVVGVAFLQLTDARWVLFVFPSVFDFLLRISFGNDPMVSCSGGKRIPQVGLCLAYSDRDEARSRVHPSHRRVSSTCAG